MVIQQQGYRPNYPQQPNVQHYPHIETIHSIVRRFTQINRVRYSTVHQFKMGLVSSTKHPQQLFKIRKVIVGSMVMC